MRADAFAGSFERLGACCLGLQHALVYWGYWVWWMEMGNTAAIRRNFVGILRFCCTSPPSRLAPTCLNFALRAAFGGCALHAPAGEAFTQGRLWCGGVICTGLCGRLGRRLRWFAGYAIRPGRGGPWGRLGGGSAWRFRFRSCRSCGRLPRRAVPGGGFR